MSAACALLLVCCADASTAFATLRDGTRVVPGAVAAYRVSWAPMGALAPKMVSGPSQGDYLSSLEARKARQSLVPWRPPIGYVPTASELARDDGAHRVPSDDDAPAGSAQQDTPAERAAPRWETPRGYVPDRLRQAQARARAPAPRAEPPSTSTARAAYQDPVAPVRGPPRWEPPEAYVPDRQKAEKPQIAGKCEPPSSPFSLGPGHTPSQVQTPPTSYTRSVVASMGTGREPSREETPPRSLAGSSSAAPLPTEAKGSAGPRWESPAGYTPDRLKAKTSESPGANELSTRGAAPSKGPDPVPSKEETAPRSVAVGSSAEMGPRWEPPTAYVPAWRPGFGSLSKEETAPRSLPVRSSAALAREPDAPTSSAAPKWKPPTGYVPDRLKRKGAALRVDGTLLSAVATPRASGLAPPKVKATPVSSPRSEAPWMGPDPVPSKKWEQYGGYDPKSRAATAAAEWKPPTGYVPDRLASQAKAPDPVPWKEETAPRGFAGVSSAAPTEGSPTGSAPSGKKWEPYGGYDPKSRAATTAAEWKPPTGYVPDRLANEAQLSQARRAEAERAKEEEGAEAAEAAKKLLHQATQAAEAAARKKLEDAAMLAKKIEDDAAAAAEHKLQEAILAAKKFEEETAAKAAAAAKEAEKEAAAKKAEAEAAANKAEAAAAAAEQKLQKAIAAAQKVEAEAAAKQAEAKEVAKEAQAQAAARMAEAEAAAKKAEAAAKMAETSADLLSDMSRLSEMCKTHVAKLAQTAAKRASNGQTTDVAAAYVGACEAYEAQLKALEKQASPIETYVGAMQQTYETTLKKLAANLDAALSKSDAKLLEQQGQLVRLEAQLAKLNTSNPAAAAAAAAAGSNKNGLKGKGSDGAEKGHDVDMSAALFVQLKAAYTQRDTLEAKMKEQMRQMDLLQATLMQTKKEAADYAARLKNVEGAARDVQNNLVAQELKDVASGLKDKKHASEARAALLEQDLAAVRGQTQELQEKLSQSEKLCLQEREKARALTRRVLQLEAAQKQAREDADGAVLKEIEDVKSQLRQSAEEAVTLKVARSQLEQELNDVKVLCVCVCVCVCTYIFTLSREVLGGGQNWRAGSRRAGSSARTSPRVARVARVA